jgi:hypothetical protein
MVTPIMFTTKPAEPTIKTSTGLVIAELIKRTFRVKETLQGLNDDHKSKGQQRDAVDQTTEDFSSLQPISVLAT